MSDSEPVGTGGCRYYLSCYLSSPDRLSVVAPRHDQNIALWRDDGSRVQLVRVWELERISGQKHHYWPLFSVERCSRVLSELLAGEGLSLEDVHCAWGTSNVPGFAEIPMPVGARRFPIHSVAHLYSGLLLDSEIFRGGTIIGMAVDGRPDFGLDVESKEYWYTGCVSRQGDIEFAPVESPGPIYDAATSRFGAEPGTLMALAHASTTEVDFDVEGAMGALELFGGSRVPLLDTLELLDDMIKAVEGRLTDEDMDPRFTRTENLQSAVMKIVQTASQVVMARNVDRLLDLGSVDPHDAFLSVSGGFALNCPANSYLLRRYGFRGLLAPPCANDSGQALGLGLLALHSTGRVPARSFTLGSPFRGPEIGDLDPALQEFEGSIASTDPFAEAQFVRDVCAGPIVWVDGPSEIGPRALGHRSLLADPRSMRSKDLLNDWKSRQWWRPVAPVVLEEYAGDWFDDGSPSPYMLKTVHVRAEKRHLVPAILHLDDSARHQTLGEDADPRLRRALEAFHRETGVPMLCNTSLNEKGEPIVDTAAQALSFALRHGAGVVYVGGLRIALRVGAGGPPPSRHPRRGDLFAGQEEQRDALWESWLRSGYGEPAMVLLARTPELRDEAIATPEMVGQLVEVARLRDSSGTFDVAAEKHARMFGPSAVFDPDSQEGAVF